MRLREHLGRGFTLIELMVVVTVLAILASAVTVALNSGRYKGRDARRVDELNSILTMLETYSVSDVALTGTGCANGSNANKCTLLANFRDPSGNTTACTRATSVPCDYVIYGLSGTQPTNGNFEICGYLEAGAENIRANKGLVYITSTTPSPQSGCPNF